MSAKIVKSKKKEIVKVIHGTLLKTNIRAQCASAAPPLGPMLGQRGLNVANFCKDFNKDTSHIVNGAVLPTRISIKPDRSYDIEICSPATSWLLMQAAGITRGKTSKNEIVGKLSVKHIYEIAKVKSKDKVLVGVPLKEICQQIIRTCRIVGIEVQKNDLNPQELKDFLDQRKVTVSAQLKELSDKKAAKMRNDEELTDQCPPGLKRCINVFTVLRNPSILPSWKPSYWTTAYNQYRAMRELFNNDEVAQIVPINHDLSIV
ncbi:39S ribosomal protein L11, mitochondrial [Strongyloides ratti]|uniref:Large ribosomal subunit protein uL11m n=1 Tax=Strongyloides ratti TaxID=34506 RepID=A0A090LH85_STRRB|nr:39S ribosomal protein L11, mitochondrial [Strongyloides ratti]CEF67493.1 39S ribosomal protein L11, mitochondrial [Strongyloides ratti]